MAGTGIIGPAAPPREHRDQSFGRASVTGLDALPESLQFRAGGFVMGLFFRFVGCSASFHERTKASDSPLSGQVPLRPSPVTRSEREKQDR